MNVSIRAARYFVAAAEAGSITKAADSLNISHSAIAAAVDTLEEEFGVQLMVRQRAKGLVLTPAGRTMVFRAKHLLEEYGQFLHQGAELGSAIAGTLHVGYFAPIAPAFVPKIIAPILKETGDVHFRFTECDNDRAQAGLRDGDFDLAIFMNYAVHPDIRYEKLLEILPYLVVPKNHPLSNRSHVRFADIIGERLVLLDLPTTLDYYRSMLEAEGIQSHLIAGANSVEMVRSLVASGLGCSILNMRPDTSQTYAGSPVACIPIREPQVRGLHIVLGYIGDGPRRLAREFTERCLAFFSSAKAAAYRVAD